MPTPAAQHGLRRLGWAKLSIADIPALVEYKKIYKPQSQNRGLYDEKFEIFKQIYKQMKVVYKRMNG